MFAYSLAGHKYNKQATADNVDAFHVHQRPKWSIKYVITNEPSFMRLRQLKQLKWRPEGNENCAYLSHGSIIYLCCALSNKWNKNACILIYYYTKYKHANGQPRSNMLQRLALTYNIIWTYSMYSAQTWTDFVFMSTLIDGWKVLIRRF